MSAALADEARVGPNAVTQLSVAIEARCGAATADAVFAAGGLLPYRAHPPSQMIPQSEAVAAHRALYATLARSDAAAIAADAGRRTADYLLAHRIPKAAQVVLKLLPPKTAATLLLKAISRHAWTFAGSGQFGYEITDPVILEIAANPLAMNPCAWHVGVFERLFRVLVSPSARVVETECTADGAPACRFEVHLRG